MTPANERKAAERQRRKEAGLVRVELWVPKGMEYAVRAYVADWAARYTALRETSEGRRDLDSPESPKVTTTS